MKSPRESARTHLPELDQGFDALRATFGAQLVRLETPDGQWGRRPAWLDWPSNTAAEMAREPWRPSVPRETKRKLA